MDVLDDAILFAPNKEIEEYSVPEEDEETTPTELFVRTGAQLGYLDHVLALPEYPTTSRSGYTYCVHTTNIPDIKQIFIQYSWSRIHRLLKVPSPIINGGLGTQWEMRCGGVLCCEYFDKAFENQTHTSLHDPVFRELEDRRKNREGFDHGVQRDTTEVYLKVRSMFERQVACTPMTSTCKPVLRFAQDGNNEPQYFICCQNYDPQTQHLVYRLSPVQTFNIIYLQDLLEDFEKENPTEKTSCHTVEHKSSRQAYCGVDHPQGYGTLRFIPCQVTFFVFIPDCLSTSRYILFTSIGEHTHVPPPCTKSPPSVIDDIVGIIQSINDSSITGTFLCSPVLKSYCHQNQFKTVEELYGSFANKDRIGALLQKERILTWPEGRDLAEVDFQSELQKHRDAEDGYIQGIYNDESGAQIICFTKGQANILLHQIAFEVDVSFKKIQQRSMSEMIFRKSLEGGKVITLGRVYIEKQDQESYCKAFQRFFYHIEDAVCQKVYWKHLSPTEERAFVAVTFDMHAGQFLGFGNYLQSIDPYSRELSWQIKKSTIFCLAHFLRSVRSLTLDDPELQARMESLLYFDSVANYHRVCDLLIANEPAPIADWAKHKRHPIIASGLNKAHSLIPPFIFARLRHRQYPVQQSAGKRLHILSAIYHAEKSDRRAVDHFNGQQVDHLNAQQADHLDTQQVDHLNAQQADHFNAQQVDHFSPRQVDHFSPRQVDHFSPQQVDEIQHINTESSQSHPRSEIGRERRVEQEVEEDIWQRGSRANPRVRPSSRSSSPRAAQRRRISLADLEVEKAYLEVESMRLSLRERQQALEAAELDLLERRRNLSAP